MDYATTYGAIPAHRLCKTLMYRLAESSGMACDKYLTHRVSILTDAEAGQTYAIGSKEKKEGNMADLKALEDRLKEIGCNYRFWGRSELRELANVLMPNEVVEHCVNGQYQGGFAMLVATDQRVLLIDKKPMYLSLEDIRYDMISEIDYNHRMMDANVHICTPNKSLRFVAYNQGRLRKLFHFVQTRVMDIRHHYQHAVEAAQTQQYVEYARQVAAIAPPAPVLAQQAQPAQPVQLAPQQWADGQGQTGNYAAPQQQAPAIEAPAPAPQMSLPAYQPIVAPIISAYTRLPILSRQRRFLGSRAMNSPMSSLYGGQR